MSDRRGEVFFANSCAKELIAEPPKCPFTRGNAALTVRVPRMEQIYRSVESL